jgi:hypothetical protein
VGDAVACDGAAGLAIGGLLVFDRLVVAVAGAGALAGAVGRVGGADVAEGLQVALELESTERLVEAAVALFEDPALLGDECFEIDGSDELVLAPIDERDDVGECPLVVAVVDEPERRDDLAQQEQLADTVEHVGPRRQAGVVGVLGQDPLAEAVEVADRHPRRARDADGVLDPVA